MTKQSTPRPAGALSRRHLVHALLGAPVASLAPLTLTSGAIAAMELEQLDTRTSLVLVHAARLLFPHPALADDVYLSVVNDVETDIAANPGLREQILGFPALLNRAADGDWSKQAPQRQITALGELEETPVFTYLRNRTIESLYRNPVVWELVGYQGSSIEHGGYLHRGFNDIDWLEEQ